MSIIHRWLVPGNSSLQCSIQGRHSLIQSVNGCPVSFAVYISAESVESVEPRESAKDMDNCQS